MNRKTPVVEIIIDGFGIAPPSEDNAISRANPEFILSEIEKAKADGRYSQLKAHGLAVGLPSDDDMGNSEVGHVHLGCGQIFSQGAKLVEESLVKGDFFKGENWINAMKSDTVHFFGLLSDGGIHSNISQLFRMLDGARESGVKKVVVHPLLDGRDVAPDSGLIFIEKLENKLADLRNSGVNALIGSGAGRMHAIMDRYESDWDIVRRGFQSMVHGYVADDVTEEYPGYFKTSKEAIECARRLYPTKLDQFNPCWVVVDDEGKPVGTVEDGDTIININFRGDRALQISRVFDEETFDKFDRDCKPKNRTFPKATYCGILEYDAESHVPLKYLLPPPVITNTMEEHLCAAKVKSFSIAETHKSGHVSYFFNGLRSGYLCPDLEKHVEIPSHPVDTISEIPEMKHREVTDELCKYIKSGEYDFYRCNLAGPDMAGHTGDIDAIVKCIQCVDECMKQIYEAVREMKGFLLVTADHGNAEIYKKNGAIVTSHTCSPVPCWIVEFDETVPEKKMKMTSGELGNVAATMFKAMGLEKPSMWMESLM